MTNQHPITPPPELVQQWASEFYGTTIAPGECAIAIATQAARWGADQELEACCEWLLSHGYDLATQELHYARRPKPPGLKQQALDALRTIETNVPQSLRAFEDSCEHIRLALEALPDD